MFCFFGFAKLVSAGQNGEITAAPKSAAAASEKAAAAAASSDHGDDIQGAELGSVGKGSSNTSMPGFVLLALVLMLQAFSSAVGNVLWPLYLKDKYSWSQNEYAYVLFAASVVSTFLVAATPSVEQILGRVNAQFLAASIAAAAAACAFQFQDQAFIAMASHISLMVTFLWAVKFMEPGTSSMIIFCNMRPVTVK